MEAFRPPNGEGTDVLISPALCVAVAATLVVAPAALSAAAPALADCGDPGQPACTGPVPTVDQVVAIMADLTDPDIPAANKTDIVAPGFSPDEAGTIDDHLNRMRAPSLPLPFIVSDIEPAPNNLAGATLATAGGFHQRTLPSPIVLVSHGGHWSITHDSAMSEMNLFWETAERTFPAGAVK